MCKFNQMLYIYIPSKKMLGTLLNCLYLENVVNSVNQVSYHWKGHARTFPGQRYLIHCNRFTSGRKLQHWGNMVSMVTWLALPGYYNQMCQNQTFISN